MVHKMMGNKYIGILGIMVPTDFHIFQRVEVKQYHKAPIWEWFYGPIYSDLADGLVLFYPH